MLLDGDVYQLNPQAFDRELLVTLQRLDASDVDDETRFAAHANRRRDPYSAGRETAAWV